MKTTVNESCTHFFKGFVEWRGDKEMIRLGIATKQEKYRSKNWKLKDYIKEAKK